MIATRILAFALPLALLLPIVVATDDAPACDVARVDFNDKFAAADNQLNAEVAQALKNAIEGCPPGVDASQTSVPMNAPTSDATMFKLALISTRGIPATACSGLHTGHSDDSPQTVRIQAGLHSAVEYDSGITNVTYEGATNAATFSVRGEKWGMDTASQAGANSGVGTIYLYGVGIPATVGTANTGCTPNNPNLCWGMGYAVAWIPPGLNLASISDTSAFYDC